MKGIINGKILTEDKILENKVLLYDKKIIKIIDASDFKTDEVEIIDASNNYVSPGFIDLHIHGSGGKDAMDGDVNALETISKYICRNGVTAFLPTTMTMSKDKIYKALDAIRKAKNMTLKGADIVGAHLEGPFISEKYKGAQKKDYILKPDYDFIKDYKDIIKIITMAPEEDTDFKFIKAVKKNTDIVLSIGHSNADYNTAVEAIKNGMTHITHLFNAMTSLNHRKPGVVGAALNSDAVCELICDKIHINPAVFNIVTKIKDTDKVVLITDCMRAGGLKDGVSELGGQKVIVKDNSARLEDGTLAGSILNLNKAIKNIFENTSLNLNEAVNMASLNPAREIKIDREKGSLKEGKDADITIFDKNFEVIKTIVGGNTVYKFN
ncbi:MAG: N-acetylglucosamine-6-phosphate deacetylase [Clostridium sp.]|nr:N-acetylglucosamine-6-phosphate deacetylase [Clostridium sp.]